MFSSLNVDAPLFQIGVAVENEYWMANRVYPDETAQYEPSHQDLHCLQRYLVWSTGLKGLKLSFVLPTKNGRFKNISEGTQQIQ